jgi:hypothetical protein
MTSEDWANIARCANERVMAGTFCFDDDQNDILGDLQTREMALSQAYRETLLTSAYYDVTMQIAEAFNAKDVLDELGDQPVRSISIVLNTD